MNQDNLPFIYPADLNKAYKHRLATRIFKGIDERTSNDERCECCDRRVGEENNKKPCCYSPIEELVFLGAGVPLLFVFIQNAMLTLSLLIVLFFFYAFLTNLLGNSCQLNTKCIADIFNQLSISNKIEDDLSLMIQTYLVAAFLLIYTVFSQYMIYRIRYRNDICDQVINSPSDYSIIIKNLPEDVQLNDIQFLVNEYRQIMEDQDKIKTKNMAVKKIIMSYSIDQYLQEKEEQEQEFKKLKKQDESLQYVRTKISKPDKLGQFAIVVFHSQFSKEIFTQQASRKKTCCSLFMVCCPYDGLSQINNKKVKIERAPQPDDILWQNADTPKSLWVRNIILSYFFGILILAGGGFIQYYLQYFQLQIEDKNAVKYFSYLTSIIITVFNAIIIKFLIFVTKHEGNYTKTDYDKSLLIKICLYSFFNAGIFYSLANILAQSLNSFNIQGSFSFQITLFMSLNSVSPNLINLLLTKLQFPKVIMLYFLKKGCFKYTQKQANKIFELTEADFPVQYAYVIRTVWLTCFYAPFVPVIVPIALWGLIVFYFTEAELFRTSYKVPNMLSIRITEIALRLMDFTGIIFSIGQILIVVYIKFIFGDKFTLLELIGIALCVVFSLVLVALPSLKINRRLFFMKNDVQNPPMYDQASQKFQVTYEGVNPMSDPDQRVRRNDINLFRFLDVMETLQMKALPGNQLGNPLLTVFDNPNNNPFQQLGQKQL